MSWLLLIACATPDQERVQEIEACSDSDEVLALAAAIEDPIHRVSAVQGWVEGHRDSLSPEQARTVCDTLQEGDAFQCYRLYSSAHLR